MDEKTIARFRAKVDVRGPDECWPWLASTRNGYGQFWMRGKNFVASRVAFFLAHGRWPVADALHSCDNPPCCNPNHLRDGTDSDNAQDKLERGRHVANPGQTHGNAIFSDAQAERIRALKGRLSQARLARLLGCAQTTISYIQSGNGWRHLTPRQKPAGA
jgi:hypothetical protein